MVPNRTLFANDCLDVLSATYIFPDNSIDLIYLDPPFNSKSQYNLPFPKEYKKRADIKPVMAFNDTWMWNDDCSHHLERLEYGSFQDQTLAELVKLTKRIRSERDNTKDSMSAYLINMAVRLKAMHRVLKPTGSIYLHCDPTASHYLKLLMDNIFGKENFRNEIIWRIGWVSGYKTQKIGWIRNHDTMLYYLASDQATDKFNKEYLPYPKDYRRRDGSLPSGRGFPIEDTWNCSSGDILDSIMIKSFSKEKLGYPTQKTLALLERIIKASSNEGDVVLDPFCGCGTTVHAAEKLGRQWVGINISQFSNGLVRNRLRRHFPKLRNEIEIRGNPISVSDALALAKRDRFEFEKWACGEIGAEGMYHGTRLSRCRWRCRWDYSLLPHKTRAEIARPSIFHRASEKWESITRQCQSTHRYH